MENFKRWRPHPWHGLSPGPEVPVMVSAYIEITPFDVVKYEIDKSTGYLKVDRPQQTSSSPPTLYGFVPQTYCADRVRDLCPNATTGDGDPVDVCVISERPIERADILMTARVVGGLQMLDHSEADDKIVAVLDRDPFWTDAKDIVELPGAMIDRLVHYFETYKQSGKASDGQTVIQHVYGREHAYRVIEASIADYQEHFGGVEHGSGA